MAIEIGGRTQSAGREMTASRNKRPRVLRPPFSAEDRTAVSRALAEGRLMTYPTETSYALGGNALDERLVERVFALKGRARKKAILLLVDGSAGLGDFARDVAPAALRLMEAFWPGPLTLVFHAAPGCPATCATSGARSRCGGALTRSPRSCCGSEACPSPAPAPT
jgi:L-threonylcarbamoyladenylate synthase